MKLNKPIITIFLIILLIINLIFFSFVLISKNTIKETFISSIVEKFDFKKYIVDDENIKKSIENYKYPIKVFDYIDESNVNIVKKKFIKNLMNNKDELVLNDDIKYILNNSIYEYENRSFEDTYDYVKEDIELFSLNFSNLFSSDFINVFNFFKIFSSDFFQNISIIFSIILSILIIFIEKRNGYLINACISFVYTLFLFYLDTYYIKNIILNNNLKYFPGADTLTVSLSPIYSICFILSFVLLLIYIIKYLKNVMLDMRVKSYERYWR